MNKDFLKDEANALITQKHQVDNAQDKLVEVDSALNTLQKEQAQNKEDLDNLFKTMEVLLKEKNYKDLVLGKADEEELKALNAKLDSMPSQKNSTPFIQELDSVEFDENMSWDDYFVSFKAYAQRNHIHLDKDPFENLMSLSQKAELQKRIKEEFAFKGANCDKYDYMIAGTCGVIGGLIDIVFVGAPGEGKLGKFTDEMANKATEKFAQLCGWDKEKALEKGSDTTKSAIGFLERKFRINYDQATTKSTGDKVKNLTLGNHHSKSLGHSPDIIGLFFSILNQFTNTSTFISNGKIITIKTENFELQGGNFIAKIFCGFVNWFGHLASDWTGSSGAQGRGSGIPIPFYNLFQLCDFGSFGQHKQTFATITTKVFEKGYDFRHGLAMAIPVAITEILIRFMYAMKARFYHKKDWKECIPKGSNPELRRMLLVGHGTLCLIDAVDAAIRSGGELVNFLARTNLIAWVRFSNIALKELLAWYKQGEIDIEQLDCYLEKEWKALLKS